MTTVQGSRVPARPVRADGRPVRALLADGAVVRLRELHDADVPLVAAFYRELPVHDRFLRFFSAGVLPAEEDLIGSRGPADVSLGAFRGEALIGVAQCSVTGEAPSTAEVALAVAHAEQAHGVGTLLLEHVASRARRAGVASVRRGRTGGERSGPAGTGRRRTARAAACRRRRGARRVRPRPGRRVPGRPRRSRGARGCREPVRGPHATLGGGGGRRAGGRTRWATRCCATSFDAGFAGRLVAVNPHAARSPACPATGRWRSCPSRSTSRCCASPRRPCRRWPSSAGGGGCGRCSSSPPGLDRRPGLAGGLLDAVPPPRHADGRAELPRHRQHRPAVRLDATFAEPAPAGRSDWSRSPAGSRSRVQNELRRLGLGVSTAVSTGDKYDVSGNDMLLWWHGDERTRVAVLHLESFGNPRKFSRFARRLAERMPVLTVRSGSSAAGQRAAASHTAATATPRVTRDALFRQAGVLAVDRLDELSELIATLSWQPAARGSAAPRSSPTRAVPVCLRRTRARRTAWPCRHCPSRTQRTLRRLLPRSAATANPVDTSAVVSPEVFAAAVSACPRRPGRGRGPRGDRGHGGHRSLRPGSPPRRPGTAPRSSRSGSARPST